MEFGSVPPLVIRAFLRTPCRKDPLSSRVKSDNVQGSGFIACLKTLPEHDHLTLWILKKVDREGRFSRKYWMLKCCGLGTWLMGCMKLVNQVYTDRHTGIVHKPMLLSLEEEIVHTSRTLLWSFVSVCTCVCLSVFNTNSIFLITQRYVFCYRCYATQ